jgi:hypothetical protein
MKGRPPHRGFNKDIPTLVPIDTSCEKLFDNFKFSSKTRKLETFLIGLKNY